MIRVRLGRGWVHGTTGCCTIIIMYDNRDSSILPHTYVVEKNWCVVLSMSQACQSSFLHQHHHLLLLLGAQMHLYYQKTRTWVVHAHDYAIQLQRRHSTCALCVPLLAIAYLCGCRESFLISHKRQRRLSGYGYIDVGLPPASPAGSDDTVVWTHN